MTDTVQSSVQLHDRLDALSAVLESLDTPHREVIVLRFQQGWDVATTAAVLGVPEGTVKSRAHAAMRRLRQLLGDSFEGGDRG